MNGILYIIHIKKFIFLIKNNIKKRQMVKKYFCYINLFRIKIQHYWLSNHI